MDARDGRVDTTPFSSISHMAGRPVAGRELISGWRRAGGVRLESPLKPLTTKSYAPATQQELHHTYCVEDCRRLLVMMMMIFRSLGHHEDKNLIALRMMSLPAQTSLTIGQELWATVQARLGVASRF